MKTLSALLLSAILAATMAGNASADSAKIERSIAWQLCAPCIPGGYVDIMGQRSERITIKSRCLWVKAVYRNSNAYAVFPDGSIGTVTGTESVRYDYCHSRKFLIHAFFNITHKNGQTYRYREVRYGNMGDPVQIGGFCEGFTCNGN